MTTPIEALERALEYLDGDSPMHSRGGHRNEVLRVEIRQALASLEGDAVERVALRRTVLDILNSVAPAVENLACNQEQADADGCMVKVSRQAVDEVLAAVNEVAIQAATATGLVAGEAAIRADEREKCAKVADEFVTGEVTFDDFCDGMSAGAKTVAAAIRSGGGAR